MSLNASPITELTSESAVFALLNEWLAGYFDGGTHDVGSNAAVKFPRVNRAFNQSAPAQPMHEFKNTDLDAEIRVVILPRSESVDPLTLGKLATDYVLLNFWVSAKKPGQGQSEYLVEQITQLLKALLTNPDTRYALAEKGITHLRPSPISPLPSADYHKRLVSASAQLQYAIRFDESIPVPPDEPAAPNPPSNLLIDAATTNGNIILNWSQGTAPTTNEIWRSINGGAYALLASISGALATYTDTRVMAAGEQTNYKVRASDGVLTSAFTSPAGILNPAVPGNLLIAEATTNGHVILNWSQATAPTTNEIWRSINGASYTLLASISGALTTFTDLHTLAASEQTYYKVRAVGAISAFSSAYTDPAGIFNGLTKNVNTGTVIYSFPYLQFVIGNTTIGNELALTTFSVPKLHTARDFILINLPALSSVDFTSLKTTGYCGVFESGITTVSWPALTTCANWFGVARNSALTSFSAPLLMSIGGDLETYNTPSLSAVSLPSLTTAGGGVSGYGSGVASVSLPALTVCGGDLNFANCTELASIDIHNLTFSDGYTINFDSDALDAASINAILAIGVASGTSTSDYELANNANSPPTGQGLTDKDTLIGAGNIVSTN